MMSYPSQRLQAFFPLLLALWASTAVALEVDRVEQNDQGSSIFFKESEKPLKAPLFELKTLGFLKSSEEGGSPYLIATGKKCLSCAEENSVFLLRSDGGKPVHFVYPGRVIDPKTGEVPLRSRAFFGKCMRNMGEVYAVHQVEKVSKRRTQTSWYVAYPGKQFLVEKHITRRPPSLDYTLRQVRKKACVEVESRNRHITAKLINLRPRKDLDESEEIDEEAPKENQTDQELPSASDS